jgi:cyclin-dependent kinase-like
MQSQYEVIGVVGEGAYGIVMKCRNKETGEIVAIKKFKDNEEEIMQKSMLRELKVLKSVKHENIVGFKECFKRKGKLYIVFEYIEKNCLEILEQNVNGLEQAIVKRYIYQLCKAINYIHSLDLIHRDIKPENILITTENIIKLCDFGFARAMPSKGGALTDYVATRWYRAPELLLGSTSYGKEVDYWAVGCIMGEISDGQPMFPGENELNQLNLIQKLLGPLTPFQQEMFFSNPRYSGHKFDSIHKPETIERRYYGKLNKTAVALMKALLKLDPKERLSGNDVLLHPYFEDIRSEDPEFINLKLNKKIAANPNSQPHKSTNSHTSDNNQINSQRTNKFTSTKTGFFPNNENVNNSKSPSKENALQSGNKIKIQKKFQNQVATTSSTNNISINTNIPNNFPNYSQNLGKTFYKNMGQKEDIYNYDIDLNFEQKQNELNQGKKLTNKNQNLNIIEEEHGIENNFVNMDILSDKKANNGNIIIKNSVINIQKTIYNNDNNKPKFNPDTGTDYGEEEGANNLKNYVSPKSLNKKTSNNYQKYYAADSNDSNKFNSTNFNFLPHITGQFNSTGAFKKINKNYK